MLIKGLKKASGETKNLPNGMENHIYYNRKSGLVFCNHEKAWQYRLYSNGSKFIMKSDKHITMNEIKKAIEERMLNDEAIN